ncbi:helix-turn-helix domain-containing protein [Parasphingorhabdus sp.]
MLSRQSIYRMIDKGYLPAIKKGRKIFIRRSEVEAAFKSDSEQAA